jgi:hypothetical protein
MTTLDDLLPKAADCRKRIAEVEAEKAVELMRRESAAETEKRELMERLSNPSGVSDEERMKRAGVIIKRAVDNGLTEVRVGRFRTRCAPIGAAPSTSRNRVGKTR